MTPSSSSLLRFVVDDFDIPICFFCSCICSTFLRLLSVQREAHCYPARMVAPEGSLWATCSTRARSRGSLARPYMLLLMSLSRFTCAWTGLPDERQFFLLSLVQLIGLTHKQPGGTPGLEVF